MVNFLDMLFNRKPGGNLLAPLDQRPDPQSYPVASPNMLAAVAGPAPAPVQGVQVAGGGGRPSDFSFLSPDKKQFLNDMFIGWAAGATPQQSLTLGAVQASKGSRDRTNQNETISWLKSRGLSDQDAHILSSSPTALNQYIQGIYQKPDPKDALELEKTQLEINKLRQGRPESYSTLSMDEKKQLGLDPNKAYQRGVDNKILEIGGNGVSVNVEAPKLPSGYQFKDTTNPSAGVEPIPGGPATQLPGELAARIGLADNWINNDYPVIKSHVEAGDVTGPIDLTAARNNKGSGAEAYRKLQSGVEVLSRLLSGAGMTKDEVAEKAARYQPSYVDDAEGMASKLEQLKKEIESTRAAALRGRGDTAIQPQGGAGNSGVVDYRTYFGGQ